MQAQCMTDYALIMSASKKNGKRSNLLLMTVIYGNMTLYGFIHSMRGVSFPLIKTSFNASYSDQGLMTALVSFAGVCFCIIPGIFMNRQGLKKTAVLGFILMIAGMVFITLAQSYWGAAALYLILQAGFGFFEIGLNGIGVRVFTKKSALMINLLHFFFGLGAVAGPRFAGFIVNRLELPWQMIYPLAIVPVVIFLSLTLTAKFPGKITVNNQDTEFTFFIAFREPLVWIIGLVMGLAGSLEACSVAWSGLFLQDVYGMSIAVEGAAFVSIFFMLYTISRLASTLFIEKAGYLRVTVIAGLVTLILYITAFSLGRNGVNLLPVTGIFISLIYPTMLAVSVGVFRERAQTCSSAIIVIAFVLNGLIQLGFGFSNRLLGPSWAYRSCILYAVIMILLLVYLGKRINVCDRGPGLYRPQNGMDSSCSADMSGKQHCSGNNRPGP